jgi:hypothetical protein
MYIFILVLLTVICAIVIGVGYRKRGDDKRPSVDWRHDVHGHESIGEAMLFQPKTFDRTFAFLDAWAVCAGALFWWGNEHGHDDVTVSRTVPLVLDGIFDADMVGRLDCATDHNLRKRVSVESVERLYREQELRRFRLTEECPRVSHSIARQRKPCLRTAHPSKGLVPRHRFSTRKSED